MHDIPISGPAFDAMMREIDARLRSEGQDIPSRPIAAVGEVSIRYGDIPIPLGSGAGRMPEELARYADVGDAIRSWYDDTYGERVKIDMSAGRVVVMVDDELYALRIPRFFGTVNFIADRRFIAKSGIGRGPATCNVVQLLDDMTPGLAAGLSDMAIHDIGVAFEIGLHAAYTLESSDHGLMSIARSDVQVAVASLMDRQGLYGPSKWASLQAAEKVLKAAIAMKGAKYKFTHGLAALCAQLAAIGVSFDNAQLVADIQCSPKIRYGEEPCSREQALAAHHASLIFVNRLSAAGVGFEAGITTTAR